MLAREAPKACWGAALVLCFAWLAGCAGHAATTKDARHALDRGDPQTALQLFNENLGVDSGAQLPNEIEPDQYLYILDRAMVQQSLGELKLSSRDLETADKGIELLDFARSTTDDIGQFLFSDDSGPYVAPPYEKLMINTVNMMNYLARGDLNGAKIEARRFAVMQKYLSDHGGAAGGLMGPGSYLAGFTFERANEVDQALRFYDEALQCARFGTLAPPVARLMERGSYTTPRLRDAADSAPETASEDEELAELLVVVNFGRVPAKIANRVPIGLALTLAADWLSPTDRAQANQLAAQGLVTWVNYPSLDKPRGQYGRVLFAVDGQSHATELMLAVDEAAKLAWKEVEGKVIGSAIVRTISRVVAGEATRRVSGGGVLGTLLSLGTQATMTAADTPDTRSWATLPARIAIGRLRLPPGEHTVTLGAGSLRREYRIELKPGGYRVLVLTSLN